MGRNRSLERTQRLRVAGWVVMKLDVAKGEMNVAFHLVLQLTAYNLWKFKAVLNSMFLKDFWRVCTLTLAWIIGCI
jgi:hypothetical protein